MTPLLVLLLALTAGIYVTPGALPVAASMLVFASRMFAGFGFILCAVALGTGIEVLVEMGLFVLSLAHLVVAWAIFRQPCRDE
jgi:hypothetical protein